MISVLAVDPGWSGQRFSPTTAGRVARVKQRIAAAGKDILDMCGRGITRDNVAEVAAAGADIIAAGSAVFEGGAVEANARYMLEAVRSRRVG